MPAVKTSFGTLAEAQSLLAALLQSEFSFSVQETARALEEYQWRCQNLRHQLWVVIETPYVDKVYRNSYYHYFSSKFDGYSRNCIKISFFDVPVNHDDFRSVAKKANLEKHYLGFMVIRPTWPAIVGRSAFSPCAMQERNFVCCLADFPITVNSVKFSVRGFPHSSQDQETISCAETTLWACMEYFSNRYADYKPALPSTITSVLSRVTMERQWPSQGLTIEQISLALKEFGFGSKIYAADAFRKSGGAVEESEREEIGNEDVFRSLLGVYVESGIPVIVALQNDLGNINHAVVAIGRENWTDELIDDCQETGRMDETLVYDLNSLPVRLVFMDDNAPAYQLAAFHSPCTYYVHSDWQTCRIINFVVPLYARTYLEAFEARRLVFRFLKAFHPILFKGSSEATVRLFLTSGRSYKDSTALDDSLDERLKELILGTGLPKFIWVAELSTRELVREKKSVGLVILDATEANTLDFKPLVLAFFGKIFVSFAAPNRIPELRQLEVAPFLMYDNNLKSPAFDSSNPSNPS